MRPATYPDYPRRRSMPPPRREPIRTRRRPAPPPAVKRKPKPKPKPKKKKPPIIDERVTYVRSEFVQILRLRVIVSILIVVLCSISLILFNVQMDAINTELVRTKQNFVAISNTNIALEAQITERHTLEEIEAFARLHLGMIMPDAAQIIEINVPRQSTVVLNMDETLIITENYFLQEIRQFFVDLRDRLFGG